MFQITRESANKLVGVQFTNNVVYTREDLKLFAETVCEEIPLPSIKKFLERNGYEHYELRKLIHSISRGKEEFSFVDVTDTAAEYHAQLFDVIYIKPLKGIPLMINVKDRDIIPVVKWRLKVAK
jgi:hypothetical protein